MGRGENSNFQAKIFRKLDLGTSGTLLGCALSPDDNIAASCTQDNKVILWDVSSGSCVGTLEGHQAEVTSCSFGNELLVTGSKDGTILVWKYRELRRTSRISVHSGPIHACVISPNGQFLATASEDKTARIYTIREGSGEFIQGPQCKLLSGHIGSVNSIAFSTDSQAMVTASNDATVRIWDTGSGELLATLEGSKGKVLYANFKSDGRQVISMTRQCVSVWSISKRQIAWEIEDKDGRGFQSLSCHPQLPMFLLVGMDGTLCGYNLANKTQLFQRSADHKGPVLTCKFSASGMRAVTGGIDGKMLVWL